jgi:MoaA/NifB/PqqE/SkfB family radical SAM enzyme
MENRGGFVLATWHWHIEISSKCTLRCPRCSRQEVPSGLVNTELDLEFFKKNFTPEFVKSHVRKITFCGDDGDPIYSHQLIEVIEYFKSIYPVQFVIITNGSYRHAEWWQQLGRFLDANDQVHFSIDGYDNDSNNQYRVNSDWDSIMRGIRALRSSSPVRMIWAAIAFEFNQDHLDRMREQAQQLGMDRFQLTRSTKFGKIYPVYGPNDALQPRDQLISSTWRFEREINDLSGRHINDGSAYALSHYQQAQEQYKDSVLPLCAVGNKGLFVNSQGDFFPCCWVANRYGHNSEWLDRGRSYNLYQRTLEQVLTDEFWHGEFQQFSWLECRTKCDQKRVDRDYATSW